MADLKSKILSGSFWAVAHSPISAVVRMGGNIVLTRLLVPEYFGLSALVTVFLVGFVLLSDLGTNEAIIRSERGDEPSFYNSVWVVNMLRGGALFVVASVAAPLLADFYGQPLLTDLLRFAAFSLLIAGTTSTSIASLHRHLEVRPIVAIELAGLGSSLAVAITWAYVDPSPWALVVSSVVNEAVKAVSSHLFFPQWRNRFELDRRAVGEVVRFGKWIFLSTVFTFLATQSDKLILGRLLSMENLGVYHVATSIAFVALHVFASVSGKILFPVLSHYGRADVEVFRTKLLEARAILMPIIAFVAVSIITVAPSFFLLYKRDYHDAGRICQYLMLVGWTSMVQECLVKAPVALGQSRVQALLSFSITVCRIGGALLGYHLAQLEGFLLGMAAGSFVGYSAIHLWARQIRVFMLGSDLVHGGGIVAVFVLHRAMAPVLDQAVHLQIAWSLAFMVAAFAAFSSFMSVRFREQLAPLIARFRRA